MIEINEKEGIKITNQVKKEQGRNEIHMNLDEDQFIHFQELLEFLHNYWKLLPFLQYRPASSNQSSKDWWIYAANSLHAASKKNHFKSWSYSKAYISSRKLYSNLWIDKLLKKKVISFLLFFLFTIPTLPLPSPSLLFPYLSIYSLLINYYSSPLSFPPRFSTS